MTSSPEEFKERTKQFSLRVLQVVENLSQGRVAHWIGGQLLRSGTSVAANYRAACRARSPAEFRSKLSIVEEEADETVFWLEMIVAKKLLPEDRLLNLLDEGNQILSMVVSSINTSREGKLS